MKVLEYIVDEIRKEDSGTALIATAYPSGDSDGPGMFVRIQSWDEEEKHEEWNASGIRIGSKVRIEINNA